SVPRHNRHGRGCATMAALALGLCMAAAPAAGEDGLGLRTGLAAGGARDVAQAGAADVPGSGAGDTGYVSSGARAGRPKPKHGNGNGATRELRRDVALDVSPRMPPDVSPGALPGQKMNL